CSGLGGDRREQLRCRGSSGPFGVRSFEGAVACRLDARSGRDRSGPWMGERRLVWGAVGPTMSARLRCGRMEAEFESTSLTDPALYDDPWAFYTWLRDEHPVWFDGHSGLHAVSRHADVIAVSRDAEHFSTAQGVRPVSTVPLSLLTMDDPEHARQRRLLARGFTPKQVRTLTEHVRDVTNEVIDAVAASGEIDFVADLAMHVPMIVITELIGLDPALRQTLYEWSELLVAGEGALATGGEVLERATNAFVAYTSLVSELV